MNLTPEQEEALEEYEAAQTRDPEYAAYLRALEYHVSRVCIETKDRTYVEGNGTCH